MNHPIDRRAVLAGAAIGGIALAGGEASAQSVPTTRDIYELRTYRLVNGPMRARLDAYLQNAFIPAARRAGCGPVGAFTISVGPGSPGLQLLIPHPTIDSFVTLTERLNADAGYTQAAAAYLGATPGDPPYAMLDVKLMRAFSHFPRIERPDTSTKRILELRTYYSHAERSGATKIGMFDTGGEIEIFRRTGLTPVFFAQDLTGHRLPSLTYMLTFPDMAARDRAWGRFGSDPAWRKLITTPGYTDPEITTGIDNQILSPTSYSQI